eukprot:g29895.t1
MRRMQEWVTSHSKTVLALGAALSLLAARKLYQVLKSGPRDRLAYRVQLHRMPPDQTRFASFSSSLFLSFSSSPLLLAYRVQLHRMPPDQVNIKDTKDTVLTNGVGIEVHVRNYVCEGKQRGVVLLVHGFSWHSGYFAPLAHRLRLAGFETVAYDLMGHGVSGSVDNMRGYARYFDDWVDEFALVAKHAQKAGRAGTKLFVLAESMGGAIVLRGMLQDKVRPDGVILTGPVVRVAQAVLPPPPVVWMVRALSNLFPRQPMPAQELADTFDSAFGDRAWAARARKDSLVVFDPPRLATAAGILAACGSNAAQLEKFAPKHLLILHGTADTRTEIANSRELMQRCSCQDKELVPVTGAAHQLFQDKTDVTEAVISKILSWLNQRA